MTGPSTVSIAIAVVDAVFAVVVARISTGPGWREIAPFSVIAASAAIFAACDSVFTLGVSSSTIVGASRIGLFVAGVHAAAWFVYDAAQAGRKLGRFDRLVVAGSLVAALLALVPHLLVSDVVYARPVPWLDVVYHDAYPTRLGELCYAYYCFAILVLMGRYVGRVRRGVRGSTAHLVGLSALFLTAVNDSFAAADLYRGPYLIDIGFLVVVVCVGTNLTSRFVESARSLEEQTIRLRATQAELVQRERLAALGELSAVVAHEVRTPVSVMFNALSVLRRQPASGQTAALLAIVEEEAHRLKRMIDDLLAFARPQTLHTARADVRQLLDGAVDAARSSTELACAVVVEVEEDAHAFECDEQLVREAVINLVNNAFHAARGREPVRVRASREGERLRIAVTDDGAGVPVELVSRLFTPFFTTRATGTGLGLAVVRRIAEAHGGEAFVEQGGGSGATFVLTLRVAARARADVAGLAVT